MITNSLQVIPCCSSKTCKHCRHQRGCRAASTMEEARQCSNTGTACTSRPQCAKDSRHFSARTFYLAAEYSTFASPPLCTELTGSGNVCLPATASSERKSCRISANASCQTSGFPPEKQAGLQIRQSRSRRPSPLPAQQAFTTHSDDTQASVRVECPSR